MPARPVLLGLGGGPPAIRHLETPCQILVSSVRVREAKRTSLGFGFSRPDRNSFSFGPLDSLGMELGPRTLSRSQSISTPGKSVPLYRGPQSVFCPPPGRPACSRSFDPLSHD